MTRRNIPAPRMVNRNGSLGTAWESANVTYLSYWWPKIKRARLAGGHDVGDLTLPEEWAVECKNARTINLPRFLREAEQEAANKGARFFVAIVKNRRGAGENGAVGDGYAVTRTRVWAELAWEHEHATGAMSEVADLTRRYRDGSITDATYGALVAETARKFEGEF